MPLSTTQLAEAHQRGEVSRDLVILSLAPKERKALEFVQARGEAVSAEIAKHIRSGLNSTINMLVRLVDYGLLDRDEVIDAEGRHYVWKARRNKRGDNS